MSEEPPDAKPPAKRPDSAKLEKPPDPFPSPQALTMIGVSFFLAAGLCMFRSAFGLAIGFTIWALPFLGRAIFLGYRDPHFSWRGLLEGTIPALRLIMLICCVSVAIGLVAIIGFIAVCFVQFDRGGFH